MKYPEQIKAWEEASSTVVLLACTEKMDIWDVHDLFHFGAIDAPWVMFYEPDIDTHTSIAAFLTPQEAKRFSDLPLLLEREGVRS